MQKNTVLVLGILALIILVLFVFRNTNDKEGCNRVLVKNMIELPDDEPIQVQADGALYAVTPAANGKPISTAVQVVSTTSRISSTINAVLQVNFEFQRPQIQPIRGSTPSRAMLLTIPNRTHKTKPQLAWIPAGAITEEDDICYRSWAGGAMKPAPVFNKPVGYATLYDNRGPDGDYALDIKPNGGQPPPSSTAAVWYDNAPFYPTVESTTVSHNTLRLLQFMTGTICLPKDLEDVNLNESASLRRLPPPVGLGLAPADADIRANFQPFRGILASHVTVASVVGGQKHLTCGGVFDNGSKRPIYKMVLQNVNSPDYVSYLQQEYPTEVAGRCDESVNCNGVRICTQRQTLAGAYEKVVLCWVS